MARITKLELEQIINERNAQLLAAREQISLLKQRAEVLEGKANGLMFTAAVATAKAAAVTAPTSAYRAALAKARDMAMASGRSVRVGGVL